MSGINLAQCPWPDCPHGERCVHAIRRAVTAHLDLTDHEGELT